MHRKIRSVALIAACVLLWSTPLTFSEMKSGAVLGGSMDSPVRIEVWSDFECPACRELYLGTIRRIVQEYSSKGKVCVVYYEFPLSMHKYSRDAARYTEAAARLNPDYVLPLYDALFIDQARWSQDGSLEATVSKVVPKKELQQLKRLMKDPSVDSAIARDVQLGTNMGVTSTPTSFIYSGGKHQKAEGKISYIVMKQYIDRELK